MKSLGSKALNFPAAAELTRRWRVGQLANGGCHEGQTKRDMTLQMVRSVSEEEHLGGSENKGMFGNYSLCQNT